MTIIFKLIAFVLGLVFLGACGGRNEPSPTRFTEKGQQRIAQVDAARAAPTAPAWTPAERPVDKVLDALDDNIVEPAKEVGKATARSAVSLGWGALVAAIIAVAIFVIPGLFAGKWEILWEGLLILAAALVFHAVRAPTWAQTCLWLPGGILAIAGLFGAREGAWKIGVAFGPLAVIAAGCGIMSIAWFLHVVDDNAYFGGLLIFVVVAALYSAYKRSKVTAKSPSQ